MSTRSRAGTAVAVGALVAVVAVVNSHRVHHVPSAVPAPAPTVVAPQRMGCAAGVVDTESTATATDNYHAEILQAAAMRCDTGQGVRGPSQVQVEDLKTGRVLAVLIKPSQGLHYYALSAEGSMTTAGGALTDATVTVTYSDWAPGHELGAMYSQAFIATDGVTFRPGIPNFLAPACGSRSLRLTAVGTGHPSAAVLRVVNVSDLPCTLEGYPSVAGRTVAPVTSALTVNARSQLHGASGGVTIDNAPSVLLLDPGETASAALDSSDLAPDGGATLCDSLTSVTVGLASGAQLGAVPVKIRVCDFQTHPWVSGETGSHP